MTTINTPIVLVVEDDPPVRQLLDDVLHGEGYEVVAVHDGPSALQVIESLSVDLITLDLDLPGLSGSELLTVLNKRRVKVPPVIVVTAERPVKRQIRRMAQEIITKPFDVDQLLSAILRLLPRDLPQAEERARQMVAQMPQEQRMVPANATDSYVRARRRRRGHTGTDARKDGAERERGASADDEHAVEAD